MSSFLAVALELFLVLVHERAAQVRTHLGRYMHMLTVKVQQLLTLEVLPTELHVGQHHLHVLSHAALGYRHTCTSSHRCCNETWPQ